LCSLLLSAAAVAESPVVAERERIEKESWDLLLQGDFEELEELAQKYREEKSRLSDGGWKLKYFYNGLDCAGVPETEFWEWDTMMNQLEAWSSAYPDSPTAKIASTRAYISLAWKARGHGWAKGVSDEAWALFFAWMERANTTLLEIPAAEKDPEVYPTLIRSIVGLLLPDSDSKKAAMKKAFEEGAEFEPEYHSTYLSMAIFLLPRWFGKPGELFEFADDAADTIGGEKGSEIYTRIMMSVLGAIQPQSYGGEYSSLLSWDNFSELLSWERAKEGFQYMEQQYPDSRWNMNSYCLIASIAGDKETARRLFTELGKDGWEKKIWKQKRIWKSKRKWALR
jgi:hypothetical protein